MEYLNFLRSSEYLNFLVDRNEKKVGSSFARLLLSGIRSGGRLAGSFLGAVPIESIDKLSFS